ncbi:MAG: GTP pyrophosphokinase family protein [Clostridiales bacterium]|nr:GTP pyrophosphokinase family protein [Clostridiales bacterium]
MPEEVMGVYEDVNEWQNLMFLYRSAIRVVRARLDTMNDEFQFIYQYNPIEYIKSRIKTPESIVAKLERDGYEPTIQNMVDYVNDIAGVRVVCSFTSDIYRLAKMIGKQQGFSITYIKDFIKHPKESGYRSYHMHIAVPVQTSRGVVPTKVELQIRTIAMDFWASLEHKIYYKFEGEAPDYISQDLRACAQIVANLDEKMLSLNKAIMEVEAEERREAAEKKALKDMMAQQ